jgi:uncharacterized protein (DUF433 family)
MSTQQDEAIKLLWSLETPAYSVSMTSRLTGINRWRVRRWLRGYKYLGGELSPVIKHSASVDSPYASFLDLIDLLFVKLFIERNFSLQRIRKVLDDAREHLQTPHFARSEFFTSGDDIVLKLQQDDYVQLMGSGQRIFKEITEKLYDKLDFEDITKHGFVCRWYPRGKRGSIMIDPQIAFGRPTLVGYGVATSNIYDLYLGEQKRIEPVSKWFNIPAPQIKTAVHFEHSLWQ